jgi:hypothetical protein
MIFRKQAAKRLISQRIRMKISSISMGLLLLVLAGQGQAHTPLFDCFDNGDDTLTCEGGFSDGASAEGIVIRVLDVQGKVLQQGELDARGSVTFDRPDGEFSVVFSAGEDHTITLLGDDIV